MKLSLLFCLSAALFLAGCTTTSISNSGYEGPYGGRHGGELYRGELEQWDVLGVNLEDREITDDMIHDALKHHENPEMQVGQKILLIQSGAMLPDPEMVEAMSQYFSLEPFSGRPDVQVNGQQTTNAPLHQRLRLAAARGGIETIVVYWGLVDSTKQKEATATASWLPFVGYMIPDETKHMRIRVKLAVIDVESGNWMMIEPDPVDGASISARMNREVSHDKMVLALKREVYQQAANELREYANHSR
ncbi:MAG: hypothetical protein E1N59_1061 [Puniceicoccaceae bacterium 5H]|nr:MAG: hypothetical protein E1N59_1061 [Puniceicoccaceae bacterium 5H]